MAPRRGCTWGVLEGGLGWDLQGLRAGIPTWAEGAWSVVFSHLLQPGQLLRELGDASALLVGVLQALDSPTTARLKKQNWKLTEIDKNKKILWIWGALKKISKTITGGALYYLCLTWLGSKACLGAPEPRLQVAGMFLTSERFSETTGRWEPCPGSLWRGSVCDCFQNKRWFLRIRTANAMTKLHLGFRVNKSQPVTGMFSQLFKFPERVAFSSSPYHYRWNAQQKKAE